MARAVVDVGQLVEVLAIPGEIVPRQVRRLRVVPRQVIPGEIIPGQIVPREIVPTERRPGEQVPGNAVRQRIEPLQRLTVERRVQAPGGRIRRATAAVSWRTRTTRNSGIRIQRTRSNGSRIWTHARRLS